MTTNEDSTMKKTPRKGPIERELRMWGYTVNGIFIPWTITQQILLDYCRLRGLLLCNAKYRYQEALINWARKQSEQTGNPSDILSREMIEVNMTDIQYIYLLTSISLRGKIEVEERGFLQISLQQYLTGSI